MAKPIHKRSTICSRSASVSERGVRRRDAREKVGCGVAAFAKSTPKISHAALSRGAARGRERRRWRELVGSISRVLRRQRPADASTEASGAKFFWLGESGTITAVAATKVHANAACRARSPTQRRATIVAKTRVSSALLQRAQILSRVCAAEKFFAARFSENRTAPARRRRGAALTHKIKWSHCYFFPAVVIG